MIAIEVSLNIDQLTHPFRRRNGNNNIKNIKLRFKILDQLY